MQEVKMASLHCLVILTPCDLLHGGNSQDNPEDEGVHDLGEPPCSAVHAGKLPRGYQAPMKTL
jgi:hypothetical protein